MTTSIHESQPPALSTFDFAQVKKPAWPIRVIRFSGDAYSEGVETHIIDGVPVKIFCVGKTVADCFKFRNKVGLDVALEALREGWKGKLFTMDELWRYAKICRVAKVMKPYLEAFDLTSGLVMR